MDYLIFERVHLYTYDLFAERVGFKLGWGCLTFYPYFYAVGLWAVAGETPGLRSPAWLALSAAVFFTGWALSRGANLQKYSFKRAPARRFLGLIEPRIVSDGERHLLCSGFWGLSRHINYLGEILMGTGLTLALGHPEAWLPWLYPLYYVALLVPRERDDDRRCAAKYGALWDEYRARVPRRMCPGCTDARAPCPSRAAQDTPKMWRARGVGVSGSRPHGWGPRIDKGSPGSCPACWPGSWREPDVSARTPFIDHQLSYSNRFTFSMVPPVPMVCTCTRLPVPW